MRALRTTAVLTALIVVLASCGASDDEEVTAVEDDEEEQESVVSDGSELRRVTLALSWLPSATFAPIYYASAQGYFEEEGLQVAIEPGRGSRLAIDDLAAGNSEFATSVMTTTILAIAEGRDVVSIAGFFPKSGFGFWVPEDSDIHEISDLAGRQVLATPGSSETLVMPAVWQLAGVDPSSVEIVNVEAAAKDSTYARGEGDAVATLIPNTTATTQALRPSRSLLFTDEGFVLPDYGFVTHRNMVENEPEVVEAFLRAALRGFEGALQDPEAAADATLQMAPEVDRDEVLTNFEASLDYYCTEAQDGMPYGRWAESDWEQGIDTLVEYAELDGPVDVDRFMTNQFFDEGDPISTLTCPVDP